MSTLLIALTPTGKLIGRCDQNCYDAIRPACNCICGGANHGIGLDNAIKNMTEHCEQIRAEAFDITAKEAPIILVAFPDHRDGLPYADPPLR